MFDGLAIGHANDVDRVALDDLTVGAFTSPVRAVGALRPFTIRG
jgi:hypothetical protein